MTNEYIPRLIDMKLSEDLSLFGAVVITGIQWCGKTTTSKRMARETISLQDEVQFRKYRMMADLDPKLLLEGERPLLIDEWQSIPETWDAVRYDVDESGKKGQFILTGSASLDVVMDDDRVRHTGAGRIARIHMRTMSLFESGRSTGEVSLSALFDGVERVSGVSRMEIRDVAKELVRGGWPEVVGMDDRQAHTVVSQYCEALLDSRIEMDGARARDPRSMRAVLRSLSRNSAMSVPATTILKDVNAAGNVSMSINTLYGYLTHLRMLCVTDDMPAWSVKLRSKTVIRTSDTRHLADPSMAAYFMGAGPEDLLADPETFGLLFESMVVRDLRVYAQSMEGEVSHYRDADGLEVDAVVHLWDGHWGAVEVRLSDAWADRAAENLLRLRDKVDPSGARPPSFLMVVTATGVAHTRPDGVHVVPVGCLRDRPSPDGLVVQRRLDVGGLQLEYDRSQPVVAAADGHPGLPDPVLEVEQLLPPHVGEGEHVLVDRLPGLVAEAVGPGVVRIEHLPLLQHGAGCEPLYPILPCEILVQSGPEDRDPDLPHDRS